jgi:hypothetical protein
MRCVGMRREDEEPVAVGIRNRGIWQIKKKQPDGGLWKEGYRGRAASHAATVAPKTNVEAIRKTPAQITTFADEP